MGDRLKCLSDIEFAAYVSGSLTPKAGDVVDRHLRSCADCTEKLEEFRAAQPAKPARPEPVDDGPIGHVLGDFRIVKEIGRGGFGVVYEAEQISLRRSVALKVLPAHVTLHPSAVERFQREASTAARLHHPGIVEIYAVGESHGTHFFAMDLIEGVPLDQVIDRMRDEDPELLDGGRLGAVISSVQQHAGDAPRAAPRERPLDETHSSARNKTYVETICRLGAQVADALQYAHEAGVIHRDIKPSNILVREDGSAVLMDFGLAREEGLPALTLTGEFAGTPYYVSPEQAMARRVHVDARTDIYSLGVTLYELLTLRRPFEGTTSQEVLGKIIAKEPANPRKFNPVIPRDLETVIQIAMEKDPDRRYQTGGDLAGDIRRFLEYRPVKARPIGAATRMLRMVRRQRVPIAAASVVLLTLMAATFAYLLRPTGLAIDTQPAAAQVFFDGKLVGVTPIHIEDADSGSHEIALVKAGYNRRSLHLELAKGTNRDLSLRLVPATGLLDCSTEPTGANVVVFDEQGKEVGSGKAPLTLTLPKGTYRARASLDLFTTTGQSLEIRDDGRLTKLTLQLPTVGCAVTINAEPQGTSVVFQSVDGGDPRTLTAPFTEPVLLRPGRYEVLCSARNHMPQRFVCKLDRGGTFEKYVSLQSMKSWSIQTRASGGTPVVADIDGDGWLDVVTATREGHVLAASGLEGKLMWLAEVDEPLTGSALVHDFDLDGKNEVVVAGHNADAKERTFVVCLDGATGKERWRRRFKRSGGPSALTIVPAGPQGRPSIAFGSRGSWTCLDGRDGKQQWLHKMQDYGGSLLPTDLESDGTHELVGRTNVHIIPGGFSNGPTYLKCLVAATGEVRWARRFDGLQLASHSVAHDLDRDGVKDLFCVGRELGTTPVRLALVCCSGTDGAVLLRKTMPGHEPNLAPHLLILDGAQGALYTVSSEGLLRFDLETQSFETALALPQGEIASMVVADANGDASLDVVISYDSNRVAAFSVADGARHWAYETDGAVSRRVALADLDADGALECLFSTRRGSLTCLTGLGNAPAWRARIPGAIRVPAAAADVTGDGIKDLVVPGQDGTCRILDGTDGHLLQTIRTGWEQTTRPVIGDVDGDGLPEVLLGGVTGDFAVFRVADGSMLWSFRADASILSVPALLDVNGDGAQEVVVGAEDCRLYCMRAQDGKRLWRTDPLRGPVRHPVSFAPSADGKRGLLFATCSGTDRRTSMTYADSLAYRIDGATGALLSGHKIYDINPAFATIDINRDGNDEVLLTTRGEVYCYEVANGKELWRYTPRDHEFATPFLSTFTHDGRPFCFAVKPAGHCVLLDGRTGAAEWWFDLDMPVAAAPILFDLDRDGVDEIVVSIHRGTLLGLRIADGMVVYSHHFGIGNAGVPPVPLSEQSLALLRSDGLVTVLGRRSPSAFLSLPGAQDLQAATAEGRIAAAQPRLGFAWRRRRFDLARELTRALPSPSLQSMFARAHSERLKLSELLSGIPMSAARVRATLAWFDRALELAPDRADALLGRAASLERTSRREDTLHGYRNLTEKHPLHLLGRERHARYLRQLDVSDDAVTDAYLAAAVAAAGREEELNLLQGLVIDSLRRGEYDWATELVERGFKRARYVSLAALRTLVVALAKGEKAAQASIGDSPSPRMQHAVNRRLVSHRRLFKDLATPRRLQQFVRERFELETVLTVDAVDYDSKREAPNPFIRGDVLLRCNGQPLQSVADLESAMRAAERDGKPNVEFILSRLGEERRFSVPLHPLGILPVADVRIRRRYTPARRSYVRASRVYRNGSLARTHPGGAYPVELSWPAAASSIDQVLELDPDGKSIGDDRRITAKTSARAVLCYDAACIHAMASQSTQGEQAEAHARRALALLRDSVRLGMTGAHGMKTDTDLACLRDRKEFAGILAQADAN
ncbi:MAG: protein kinase domain-containing protein [Planctomycetota bacterium]